MIAEPSVLDDETLLLVSGGTVSSPPPGFRIGATFNGFILGLSTGPGTFNVTENGNNISVTFNG